MDLYRDWSKGDEFSGEIEYIRTHLEIRLFHVLIVDTIDHLGKDPDFLVRFVTLLNENGKKVYEVERDIEISPELIRNGG